MANISVATAFQDAGGGTNNSTSLTISTGDYLLCFAQFPRDQSISSVTWNGVSLDTLVYEPGVTAGWVAIAVYGLFGFTKGTYTFASTASNASTWFQVVSFYNATGVRNISSRSEGTYSTGTIQQTATATAGDNLVGYLRAATTYFFTGGASGDATILGVKGGTATQQMSAVWCATASTGASQTMGHTVSGTDVNVTGVYFSLNPALASKLYLKERRNRLDMRYISK